MKIDQTFLHPHPRTLQWWEERKMCQKCAHLKDTPIKTVGGVVKSGGGMVCTAIKREGMMIAQLSCIMAREGPCGPRAVMFKEKTR